MPWSVPYLTTSMVSVAQSKYENTNLEVKVDVHVLAEPAIDVAKLLFFAALAKTK
jgi:hypothetical protein